MTRNIGGSILPAADATTYKEDVGTHGTFRVIPVDTLDTHVLQFTRKEGPYAGTYSDVCSHPNGYTCKELANRILKVWEGTGTPERALQQFDYALACGGMGRIKESIERLIAGEW